MPDHAIANGTDFEGTGTGRRKNVFPRLANPNQVLYRTNDAGQITYFQVYDDQVATQQHTTGCHLRTCSHTALTQIQSQGRSP